MTSTRRRRGEDRANPRARLAARVGEVFDASRAWKVKDAAGTDLIGWLMFALGYMDDAQVTALSENVRAMVPWARNRGAR
jgi:hypothetical protein